LVIVGAAALAIACFLPFDEPTGSFRMVSQNTLVQMGDWWLIGLALGIAGSGYRAYQYNRAEWWVPLILSIIGAVVSIGLASDKDMRTLYPMHPDGTVDTSNPGTLVSLGVAIYVAGAGLAAALLGSFGLSQSARQDRPDEFVERALADRATKKCPDCAETILTDANVCKHLWVPVCPCDYVVRPVASTRAVFASTED
jgi:hypothetical protein